MTENEIARHVVDAAFRIHSRYGPGLLETAYEAMLVHELMKQELRVRRQVSVPIIYDGVMLEEAFKADLIVNDLLIVELKATEEMHPVFARQLLTYLKLTGKKLGLLINFGMPTLKEGLERVIHGTLSDI